MEIFELVIKIIGILFMCFLAFLFLAVFVRGIQMIAGTTKTVDATVIKKYKVEEFTKYTGTGKKYRYVVVFKAGHKTLRLNVSEYAYSGYKENEKGRLTYKGNRLVEFS